MAHWFDDPLQKARFRQRDNDMPGWVAVSLDGWDRWLTEYGLDRFESLPAEKLALRSLSKQAREWVKAGGASQLTILHRELITLDRYYLEHYERREFALRYWQFTQTFYSGAVLQASHRLSWVADRMGWYVGTPRRPDAHLVSDLLDEADARITIMESVGQVATLYADVNHLLTVRATKQVA